MLNVKNEICRPAQLNGQMIPLTLERGIDILGDIVEAAEISPNPQFYGDFHNMGHVAIAFSHDPLFRHRVNPASTNISKYFR